MKSLFKKILLIVTLYVPVSLFSGCEPSDANKDYGFPKIYIPQATVTGLDNTYPIPNGPFGQNSSYTCRFEDGKLNISLGVVRAGSLADEKGFTVDLAISESETSGKVAALENEGKSAMAIPAEMCSVPDRITVAEGSNSGTCYVSVDMEALAGIYDDLKAETGAGYKSLVLGLAISNPSYYELSDTNTSVVIVLDLNSGYWDSVTEDMPESEVRVLFPAL